MQNTIQRDFPTMIWAQCRNEAPFPVTVSTRSAPGELYTVIDCPHCHRGYKAQLNGEWISDRPLQFLTYEEARKHRI